MHNSSVHTENGFRGVPVAVAYRGKRSDQATTMFSGMSAHSPFNTERRRPTLFKQDSENIVQILTSTRRLPLSPSFYFQFILYPSQPLAPKLMTLLNSVYHSIRCSEVDCYTFVQSCSFGRSLQTRLAGCVINHFCTRCAIFLCSL